MLPRDFKVRQRKDLYWNRRDRREDMRTIRDGYMTLYDRLGGERERVKKTVYCWILPQR